jgi:hypothetical protein
MKAWGQCKARKTMFKGSFIKEATDVPLEMVIASRGKLSESYKTTTTPTIKSFSPKQLGWAKDEIHRNGKLERKTTGEKGRGRKKIVQ